MSETATAPAGPDGADARWTAALVLAVVVLTAARALGVLVTPVELHGDEAQYWAWSRELAWGYYSKPPLIGWTIAATTAVFGDIEWAVRIAAPFVHGVAAIALGLLARDLAGPRAGLVAGLAYGLMPAVWLSSGVISTDALLLPLWSVGLLALHRFARTGALVWAVVLGFAAGFAFLAKYAAIYFVIGTALAMTWDRELRSAMLSRAGLVAALITAALIAPNLIWNAANDFATVSHTAANANWTGPNFRPHKLGEFWLDQLGVFGPITFGLLIAAVWGAARLEPARRAIALRLLAFIIPAFVIVSAQAFINRANANWAASIYAAGSVLAACWVVWKGRGRLFAAAAVLHLLVGGVFAVSSASPRVADAVCWPGAGCLGGAFKRARGWARTTAEIRAVYAAGEGRYAAVVVDNRLLFHGMEYYGRRDPLPLAMWRRQFPEALSHAEARAPLAEGAAGPVLVVSERPQDLAKVRADFERFEDLGGLRIPLGAGQTRALTLHEAAGYQPLARGPAYEARWSE